MCVDSRKDYFKVRSELLGFRIGMCMAGSGGILRLILKLAERLPVWDTATEAWFTIAEKILGSSQGVATALLF